MKFLKFEMSSYLAMNFLQSRRCEERNDEAIQKEKARRVGSPRFAHDDDIAPVCRSRCLLCRSRCLFCHSCALLCHSCALLCHSCEGRNLKNLRSRIKCGMTSFPITAISLNSSVALQSFSRRCEECNDEAIQKKQEELDRHASLTMTIF